MVNFASNTSLTMDNKYLCAGMCVAFLSSEANVNHTSAFSASRYEFFRRCSYRRALSGSLRKMVDFLADIIVGRPNILLVVNFNL